MSHRQVLSPQGYTLVRQLLLFFCSFYRPRQTLTTFFTNPDNRSPRLYVGLNTSSVPLVLPQKATETHIPHEPVLLIGFNANSFVFRRNKYVPLLHPAVLEYLCADASARKSSSWLLPESRNTVLVTKLLRHSTGELDMVPRTAATRRELS